MIGELIIIIFVLLNFIALLFHKLKFKEPKNKVRKIWGILLIVITACFIFYYIPHWIYGLQTNISITLSAILLGIVGVLILMINRNLRARFHVLIVPVLFHILLLFLLYPIDRWNIFNWDETSHTLFPWYFAVSGLFLAGLYYLVRSIISKHRSHAILPALQIVTISWALPYLPLEMEGRFYSLSAVTLTTIIYYVINIIPETMGFVGITLLRMRLRVIGYTAVLIAVLLGIEIIPMRAAFRFHRYVVPYFGAPWEQQMSSSGKSDREIEFRRSLHIIETLAIKSETASRDHLDSVVIYVPNLDRYPDILKLDTNYHYEYIYADTNYISLFERKIYLIDRTIDSDNDGITDFMEAEILCDAYDKDTDDDGFDDNVDSDPLNPFIDTEIGKIKAAVLSEFPPCPDPTIPYIIENSFYNNHGEIAHFSNHTVILHWDQVNKWNVIFGEQYVYFGQRSYYGQYVEFGKFKLDLTGRIAVIGLHQHHGIWADSGGWQILLIKPEDTWVVLGVKMLWY